MDKNRYHKLIASFDNLKKSRESLGKTISDLKSGVELLQTSTDFLFSFSEFTRNKVKEKLESLANSALSCIFPDKTLEFKVLPNKTKKGLNYDLYIETDGVITPLFDAKGGGVLDVVALSLRVSFVRFFSGKLRQVIILDEPFKNLDSYRVNFAIEWLKTVSKELEMQFIIITHIKSLIEKADKGFHFVLKNGETNVERF
jgi:DNA repair exonuclease SbcCD ATPase subunit